MTGSSPEVLALTDDWLVVNKPAGWLSIPGRSGVLPAGVRPPRVLLDWAKETYGPIWVVHRLDLETSGVLLLARSAAAHRRASLWFQEHEVKKNYDCLAVGVPSAPVFKVKLPIAGAPSVTQFEVRESYAEGFLARATPVSGRRHQIRIHLSSEGHPLWGDRTYRGPQEIRFGEKAVPIDRVALHAARLELPGKVVYEAPWPADFKAWVETLRAEGHRV